MRRLGTLVVVLLLLASIFVVIPFFIRNLEAQHIPHDKILIDGDEDFIWHATNQSWPGAGTEGNPFILENFEINRTSENGIEIRNTTIHFVIRNAVITDCDNLIKLQSVQNGIIENCVLNNSEDCVVIENSNNIHIEGNNITSRWDSGISLISSHNINIIDNSFYDCRWGVSLSISNENLIVGNDFSEGLYGISLRRSNSNQMLLNKLTNNDYGISLSSSCNNVIENNTMDYNSDHGIFLIYSNNSIIAYNTLEKNMRGIGIEYSINNNVYENEFVDCGIILWGYEVRHWSEHDISTSNNVNSKPIYYINNQNGGGVPHGAGQIILANCTNVTVEDHSISEVDIGIQMGHSTNNNIKNNSISSTNRGAIYIYNSEHNNFSGNRLFENRIAILTWYSNNNTFEHNEIKDNEQGIYFRYCSDNSVHNNTLENNTEGGIYIPEFYYYSRNNSFYYNSFINDGFEIEVYYETNFESYTIDTSNTVNGKPIFFWENKDAETIPPGAGQIILINCSNITIENQEIENTTTGIKLFYSREIKIMNNKIADANNGIYFSFDYLDMESSYNNFISGNEIHSCIYGMYIRDIIQSNIINNTISHCKWDGINIWGFRGGNNITNNTLSHNSIGLDLGDVENNVSGNLVIGNEQCGINIWDSGNSITNNIINSNGKGIILDHRESHNNAIIDNMISDNEIGIFSEDSIDCRIIANNISTNSRHGIETLRSNNIVIENNYINHNNEHGIQLNDSEEIALFNNTLENNGVFISSYFEMYWENHEINSSNTVNGKPLYYWTNIDGGIIPNDAGQIILASCRNINIQDQVISNTSVAIAVGHSSYCLISNNELSHNKYGLYQTSSWGIRIAENIIFENHFGIYLTSGSSWSHQNSIVSNEIFLNDYGLYKIRTDGDSIIANNITNNELGILLNRSEDNVFHHNNIIDNKEQLIFTGDGNEWNDEIDEGNFWSDYMGTDTDGDGIGNTLSPHNEVDGFPLMDPADITLDYEHLDVEQEPNGEEEVTIFGIPFWVLGFYMIIFIIFIITVTYSFIKKVKKIASYPGQQIYGSFGFQRPIGGDFDNISIKEQKLPGESEDQDNISDLDVLDTDKINSQN